MEKSTQFATEERGEKFFGPPAREPLDKERLSRQVWDSMRNGRFTAQRFFDTGTTKTDSTYKESSRSRSRSRNKVELPEELEGFGEPASKETGENKRDGSSDEGSDGKRDRNREDDSELEKENDWMISDHRHELGSITTCVIDLPIMAAPRMRCCAFLRTSIRINPSTWSCITMASTVQQNHQFHITTSTT